MNKKLHENEKLLEDLLKTEPHKFPVKGSLIKLGITKKQGVYLIYNPKDKIVHVGRTQRGKFGLRQRLNNHLYVQSSFVINYLNGDGGKLRARYKFKLIIIKDERKRALLEAFAIGKLCPIHLGLWLGMEIGRA